MEIVNKLPSALLQLKHLGFLMGVLIGVGVLKGDLIVPGILHVTDDNDNTDNTDNTDGKPDTIRPFYKSTIKTNHVAMNVAINIAESLQGWISNKRIGQSLDFYSQLDCISNEKTI